MASRICWAMRAATLTRWKLIAASALAGLSLLLFFPSWTMLTCIAVGILAWFALLLVLRYGREAGLRLWTVFSAHAPGTRVAGLGAYALAALIYCLVAAA